MKRMSCNSAWLGLGMACLLAACATTRILSSWKDRTYGDMPEKILVVGIAGKAINQRIMEDKFVEHFQTRGTEAVAGYRVLSEEESGDREAIERKMNETGAEAMLIARLADKETVYSYTPGTTKIYAYPAYYRTWRSYYGHWYDIVHTPGYVTRNTYAIMETNLYAAAEGDMVWSAYSRTELLRSDRRALESYIDAVVQEMAEDGLVREKEESPGRTARGRRSG